MNVEFLATKSIGNVTVINGDFNNMSDVDGDGDVDDNPTDADADQLGVDADLLRDVIFQAMTILAISGCNRIRIISRSHGRVRPLLPTIRVLVSRQAGVSVTFISKAAGGFMDTDET